MKTKRSGLTVIEILVVVGIIAILVGLLLPAVYKVQKMAKDTKQRAQFTAIELGLAAFKQDYGDYPPSFWYDPSAPGTTGQKYCGAQKLAEALLGWDLLGFHPDSAWRSDGLGEDNGNLVPGTVYHASDTLKHRKDRYIEMEMANPFLLGGGQDALFPGDVTPLAPRTYVLCDVYGRSERRIQLGNDRVKMVMAGSPILYYRANPSNLRHLPPDLQNTSACIYDARDNAPIINLGYVGDATKAVTARRQHRLAPDVFRPGFDYFYYDYIRDDRVESREWPYRPDSYLLISAGMDGLYGTEDDIRNFGN